MLFLMDLKHTISKYERASYTCVGVITTDFPLKTNHKNNSHLQSVVSVPSSA